MSLDAKDQQLIRSYLLGHLTKESQLQQVEERLLIEDPYFQELLALEDDLIDEYLGDALSAADKERFEQHFLSTPERRQKLRFAVSLKKYIAAAQDVSAQDVTAPPSVMQPIRLAGFRSRPWLANTYLRAAAAVLIIIGLAWGGWYLFLRQSEIDKGLLAFKAAYRRERPLEARLSALDYAPLSETRGNAPGAFDSASRNRAERILLDAAAEHPGAAAAHALGQLYAAERKFDAAIEQFEAALKTDPDNARLHNDLGAALLESGKAAPADDSGKSIEAFARSLDHFNRALELDPNLLDALFNRALAHQYLRLPPKASEDWRKYLEKDPDSKWAAEARENLRQLEAQQIKSAQTQEEVYRNFTSAYQSVDERQALETLAYASCRAGNFIVERLADNYLRAAAHGSSGEAQSALQMLLYAGEARARKTGDRYISDMARRYQSVTPQHRAKITQARELSKSGQAQIAASQFPRALESYTRAKQLFDQAGDVPESSLAAYWLAICHWKLDGQAQSDEMLRRLAADYERHQYNWLAARSLSQLASYQMARGEYSKAVNYSARSEAMAAGASETYGQLSALTFLMVTYVYLGNARQSLNFARRILMLAALTSPETIQNWRNYSEIAWTFYSLGFYAAAADYQKVALEFALQLPDPSTRALDYARLGAMEGRTGDYDSALKSIEAALQTVEPYRTERFAQETLAYASLQRGDLYRQMGRLDEAVAAYDQSLAIYTRLESKLYVYQAHKGKLLAYIAAQNLTAANEEIAETLDIYEQNRSRIIEESNRNNFFDLEQNVYDVAIDFEFTAMNDAERAFDYSERNRARSLLEAMSHGQRVTRGQEGPDLNLAATTSPLGARELRERLPDKVQLVQYAVLDSKLLIWVVSKRDLRAVAQEISARQLDEKIRTFVDAIAKKEPVETESAAKDLYGVLIAPIEALLDQSAQIFIVPDKNLNYLPFTALVSPATGKYLIEDYRLALAPSANMMLASTLAAQRKPQGAVERLLSVGVSTFDRREFPELEDLPDAVEEAEGVATYYTAPQLLIGERATRREVVAGFERADVIHLATHSITDERAPLRSKLLLAQGAAGNEELSAAEIYELPLPRARLVILSACQTGTGRAFRGEGVMSMARPFLARDVPLVIASLWAVDSKATAKLMIALHQNRKRAGQTTADALRNAQLEMLHGPEPLYRRPYYWASFNLIGGYAEI